MKTPICLLIDPLYVIDVEGKDMHFEWNERCGPLVVDAEGNVLEPWPLPESHPFWTSLGKWISCGSRVDDKGRCILEPPSEESKKLCGKMGPWGKPCEAAAGHDEGANPTSHFCRIIWGTESVPPPLNMKKGEP